MNKFLLSLSALCLSALMTHAQTDVTNEYLPGGSFENCTAAEASVTASKTAATTGATNGEWTYAKSAAWSCSAIVAYGQSDVQINGASAPSTDNAGNTGLALGVSVGWSGAEEWRTADVTLPAGKYTLKYYAYNNYSDATQIASHVGFVTGTDDKGIGTGYLSTTKSFAYGQWVEDVVEFTLTESTTGKFQVGGQAISKGSDNNAKVFFDNLTLTYTDPLSAVKEAYEAAKTTAETAIASDDYVNVTGEEKTALQSAIDATVSEETEEAYTKATEALTSTTTAFTAAKAVYDGYVAEKAIAESLNITVADAPTSASAAAEATTAIEDQIAAKYSLDVTSANSIGTFGDWTFSSTTGKAAQTGTSQHWSDTNTHTYYEQSGSSWGASSFTDSYTKTVTLPAGSYVLKFSARASLSAAVTATATVGEETKGSVTVNSKSDNGYGIDTSGKTNFSSNGTYANNGAGRGWEWYYLPVTVEEKSEVTFTVTAEASAKQQWFSLSDMSLLQESVVDFRALNEAISTAETLNSTITNGVTALATATTTAKGVLETATTQNEADEAVSTLNTAIESAKPVIAARVKAYGYYKKYSTLNKVIKDESQDEVIAALETVYQNADATEEDVTEALDKVTLLKSYTKLNIANGTFDENVSIAADGTNSGTLVDGTSTLYEVDSWTSENEGTGTLYAATAYYGAACSGTTGTNSTNAPAADMFGESEGGALHISSGWEQKPYFTQGHSLKAGQYVYYYEAYNSNSSQYKTLDSNYFGLAGLSAVPGSATVTGNNEVSINSEKGYVYENNKSYESGEWTPIAMSFELTQAEPDAKVTIGLKGKSYSYTNAKLWVDNVEVYYIPAEMTTYTRTATTSGYGTICLPYKAQPAENVTVYEIAGVDDTENPTTLYLTEVTDDMVAGTPYIYYAADDETPANAVFSQVSTKTVTEPVAGKNNLTGVFTSTKGGVADGSYILSGGKWYCVNNQDDFNLGDNRAYISKLEGMEVTNASTMSGVKAMNVNDDATGISSVENASKLVNGSVYTLSGQRVSNVSKDGIYIVNGKKVFVK